MSFLGGITVTLNVHNRKVEKASVRPDKEVKAEQLLIGQELNPALDRIESLFTLCPHSQSAAAEAAFCTILFGSLNEEQEQRLRRTIYSERIAEGFRLFVLQLPKAKWREKHIEEIKNLWAMTQNLVYNIPSEPHWFSHKDSLSYMLSHFLENAFEGAWDNDLLNGTFRGHLNGVTSIFSELSKKRTLGLSSAPLLNVSNEVFLENLKSTGTSLEKFSAGPFDFFTGACARMRHASLTSALLKSDGPSAYTRFAARFEELYYDLQVTPRASDLFSCIRLSETSAISIVQNSRGALLHYVKIEKPANGNEVIADYCILTPTEINVTKAPSFLKSLEGMQASTLKELQELAQLVVLSYDPCTEIKLEIDYA